MGNQGACALYEEEVEMPNPEKFEPAEPVKYDDNKIYYNDGSWYQGEVDGTTLIPVFNMKTLINVKSIRQN